MWVKAHSGDLVNLDTHHCVRVVVPRDGSMFALAAEHSSGDNLSGCVLGLYQAKCDAVDDLEKIRFGLYVGASLVCLKENSVS